MAVHKRVARARGWYNCDKCGVLINPGEPYEWRKLIRFGAKQYRCASHRWTPRELRPYGTGKTEVLRMSADGISDAIADQSYETPEELEEAIAELAQEAREAAQEYEANVDSMESGGFSETMQMSTMRETAQALEDWADELEGWTAPEQTAEELEIDPNDPAEYPEREEPTQDWYEEIDAEVLASVPGYGG